MTSTILGRILSLATLAALPVGLCLGGVLQVGTGGGTTAPGPWTSGDAVSAAFTALTVDPAKFGDLYDSASGKVGGGMVSGDLYYAFTARSLDRAGDSNLPMGSNALNPYSPGTSFAGGQLVGDSPSLSVSQAYGNWAMGYNIGANGSGPNTYFGNPIRLDMAPARVALFEVHVHYNASAADTATITLRTYDNLLGQRQPTSSDVATYTQVLNTASSDFSFSSFQFISGHADTVPSTRWIFSNVVFAQNANEASDYLLALRNPTTASVLQASTGVCTNSPGDWTSGDAVFNAITALTVIPEKFGSLYDSASGLVGGGTVAGDVYYAFTARPLDRAGDTLLPAGSSANSPYSPSTSLAGGQLVGATPSLGLGQGYTSYGLSYFLGLGIEGPRGDFSPRIDLAPARVCLYDVWLHFNASGNDTATIALYAYDNLPNQRQPVGSDTPTYTRYMTLTGDFSFNAFRYIVGHADTMPTRWVFSNVVFARDAASAADYILNPPLPPGGTVIAIY